jgi:hypothetical protein
MRCLICESLRRLFAVIGDVIAAPIRTDAANVRRTAFMRPFPARRRGGVTGGSRSKLHAT